jgi:CRISPR-associated protein Csm3
MVLDILCEQDRPLIGRLIEALRLLEDDTLGGGGSRGSGRVRFADLELTWRGQQFYSEGAAEQALAKAATVAQLQSAASEPVFAEKLS